MAINCIEKRFNGLAALLFHWPPSDEGRPRRPWLAGLATPIARLLICFGITLSHLQFSPISHRLQ